MNVTRLLCAVLAACLMSQTALYSQPARLSTFGKLLSTLKGGFQVRATVEYAKCRLVIDSVEHQAPEAVDGMAISTYEYFARGVVRNAQAYVATSETHLIAHPRYGYVHNYVRLRIFEDATVEIVARYLNPTTYAVVMDEAFYGALSDGNDTNGVMLFRLD